MERRRRILLADDDQVILKSVGGFLQRHGYEVLACQDGPTALLKARSEKPDLAVVDLGMQSPRPTVCPIFDGYTLMGWFRSIPETARMPVIVLTGAEGSDTNQRCMLAGATATMHKPANMQRLLNTIRIELDEF
ncbi:MAG: response regulator [Verrucomicrobia bacterium]|nr:response regulator [Verrucomicrobiota bacterium]